MRDHEIAAVLADVPGLQHLKRAVEGELIERGFLAVKKANRSLYVGITDKGLDWLADRQWRWWPFW